MAKTYRYEHMGYVLEQTSYNWHYVIRESQSDRTVAHSSYPGQLTEEEAQQCIEGFLSLLETLKQDEEATELTPGDPENCQGNGEDPNVEIQCDNCDYYLACFPEAMPSEEPIPDWMRNLRANEVFVKQCLQELKELGELEFLERKLEENSVRHFWEKVWYPEAVWLLKAIDCLTQKHFDCVAEDYQDIRQGGIFHLVPGPEPAELEAPGPWLRVCRVRCKLCGTVLERTYKSPDDYGGGLMTCKCGKVSLDPSPTLWRVNGDPEHYEIQNELAED